MLRALILALSIVIATTGSAAALRSGPDAVMPLAVMTPPGMRAFCRTYAEQCLANDAAEVSADAELTELLQAVNDRVNRAIRPVPDGVNDRWTLGGSTGDCEDYVLAKRAQLHAAGLPLGALRIAIVKTRRGITHAVLIVKTDNGDLVLDNLGRAVRPVAAMPYRMRYISSADPMHWTAVL